MLYLLILELVKYTFKKKFFMVKVKKEIYKKEIHRNLDTHYLLTNNYVLI